MGKLFTAIDAEPARPYKAAKPGLMARFGDFVAGLSPRALAYSALAGAVLVVVQAGVIGTLVRGDNNFVTASFPVQTAPGTYGLIRFAPDASAEAITTLLGEYDASIVSGPQSGMFRVRFGRGVMSKADATAMLTRLKGARIVTFAEFAQ